MAAQSWAIPGKSLKTSNSELTPELTLHHPLRTSCTNVSTNFKSFRSLQFQKSAQQFASSRRGTEKGEHSHQIRVRRANRPDCWPLRIQTIHLFTWSFHGVTFCLLALLHYLLSPYSGSFPHLGHFMCQFASLFLQWSGLCTHFFLPFPKSLAVD